MYKVLFIISVALITNACGKKGSGTSVSVPEKVRGCVFSYWTTEQILETRKTLADIPAASKTYTHLSSSLVFELLKYNQGADVLTAIEDNHLVGFLSKIFDEKSSEILDLDLNDVELIKECNWE